MSGDHLFKRGAILAAWGLLLLLPAGKQALAANPAPAAGPVLHAIQFVDAQHGWAAGQGIYVTSDGGRHWQRQYAGSSEISQVDFIDATHGWAVGNGGNGTTPILLRTVDGGKHWTKATEPPPPTLTSVQFLSTTLGFGVTGLSSAGGGALVMTTNGGSSWTGVHTPLRVDSTCFTSSTTGWAVALQGDTILRTTDGGKQWTRSFNAGSEFMYGGQLACASATNAWALLYGGVGMSQESYAVYHTTDGVHWQAVLASSTAGAGPAPGPTTKAQKGISGYGAVLDALNGQTAFLLGGCPACGMGETYLASTTNGGRNWTNGKAIAGLAFGDHDLSFVTAKEGWLASETLPPNGGQPYGVILHTTNGGTTWSRQFPAS